MFTPAAVTRSDKALAALASLAGAAPGGPGVTTFAAVVRLWETDRQTFGLPGFKDAHPHSNAVIVHLVRLKKDGLVESTGTSRYRLTRAGAKRAEKLAATTAAARS